MLHENSNGPMTQFEFHRPDSGGWVGGIHCREKHLESGLPLDIDAFNRRVNNDAYMLHRAWVWWYRYYPPCIRSIAFADGVRLWCFQAMDF
ncbi:hypothetical protein DSLASN_31810 [Desulfoluna limicola]|uniref:Uncharacterized protein n=1 Tax=Desulfoluna limicola TaxID=2810562 RepID=A0ABM7PKB5_9BACT|nr:hypothetical protein DSLASN_31810 [Desulfoluna limicola]